MLVCFVRHDCWQIARETQWGRLPSRRAVSLAELVGTLRAGESDLLLIDASLLSLPHVSELKAALSANDIVRIALVLDLLDGTQLQQSFRALSELSPVCATEILPMNREQWLQFRPRGHFLVTSALLQLLADDLSRLPSPVLHFAMRAVWHRGFGSGVSPIASAGPLTRRSLERAVSREGFRSPKRLVDGLLLATALDELACNDCTVAAVACMTVRRSVPTFHQLCQRALGAPPRRIATQGEPRETAIRLYRFVRRPATGEPRNSR